MIFSKRTFYILTSSTLVGFVLFFSIHTCQRFEPEGFIHVSAEEVQSLGEGQYRLSGNLEEIGGDPITQHGFCWAKKKTPTISGSSSRLGQKKTKGSFSSIVESGLDVNASYYVRAYVTTAGGTEYSEEKSFYVAAQKPTVITTAITNVLSDSATGGGNVISDGGASVKARGVCWRTSSGPVISDNKTTDGSGIGSFTSTLTGLSANTKYYVRAYATNSAGTAYGDEQAFTTEALLQEIKAEISINKIDTVEFGQWLDISCNVRNLGTDSRSFGVEAQLYDGISLVFILQLGNQTTITLSPGFSANVSFEVFISDNWTSAEYLVEAIVWSGTPGASTWLNKDSESFAIYEPINETISDIDGNEYQIIQIGEQVWMAENLKTSRYANGSSIPLVEANYEWDSLQVDDKAYCWYNNSTANLDAYGGLYTWAAAVNGDNNGSSSNPSGIQGVCPDGWHLPSDGEWQELEISIGMSQSEAEIFGSRGTDEGKQLKADYGWNNDGNGTDDHGFSALPAGRRDLNGSFMEIYYNAYIWTTTELGSNHSYYRGLFSGDADVDRYEYNKSYGFSVRCVKD